MFAQRLAYLMDRRSVSAYRIRKDNGFSNSIVADWLAGKRTPDLNNLIKLADYFDVSLDYLAGRSDEP